MVKRLEKIPAIILTGLIGTSCGKSAEVSDLPQLSVLDCMVYLDEKQSRDSSDLSNMRLCTYEVQADPAQILADNEALSLTGFSFCDWSSDGFTVDIHQTADCEQKTYVDRCQLTGHLISEKGGPSEMSCFDPPEYRVADLNEDLGFRARPGTEAFRLSGEFTANGDEALETELIFLRKYHGLVVSRTVRQGTELYVDIESNTAFSGFDFCSYFQEMFRRSSLLAPITACERLTETQQ